MTMTMGDMSMGDMSMGPKSSSSQVDPQTSYQAQSSAAQAQTDETNEVEQKKFCSQCGAAVRARDRFCAQCGSQLNT